MQVKIAVIGECMLELREDKADSGTNAKSMKMGFGGDTLNTSVYLARNGIATKYVTALGDDSNSDWLIDEWQKEGVDCSLVSRATNSAPGLYMIEIDDTGERSFSYWRKHSPASCLFDDADKVAELFDTLNGFSHLYLSGISLAILPAESLARLFHFLLRYRNQGGRIIFDGNYRPSLWSSVEVAQAAYERIYQMTDIALPTFEDEEMLYGYENVDQLIAAIAGHGVKEIVVKMGSEGCLSYYDGKLEHVAAIPSIAIDTTAAGDSFNAGYLSARLKGLDVIEACGSGHGLASKVIQHRGAIMPKA